MLRRVFTFTWLLSLVLCLSAIALWVRSYSATEMFLFENRWNAHPWIHLRQTILRTGRGGVGIFRSVSAFDPTNTPPRSGRRGRGGQASTRPLAHGSHISTWAVYPEFRFGQYERTALGFKFGRYTLANTGARPGQRAVELVVPIWALVVLTAVLPARAGWKRLRRTGKAGACSKCGYDLTGNTSGVCPECGDVRATALTDVPKYGISCPELELDP